MKFVFKTRFRWGMAAALLSLALLVTACAAQPQPTPDAAQPESATPQPESITPQPESTIVQPESTGAADLSGTYTDCQGTSDVYSELTLEHLADGTYAATIGLYRIGLLEGIAQAQDGGLLLFTCEEPAVQGEITLGEDGAVFTVTQSAFSAIEAGEVYRFPDGKTGGAEG